MSQIVEIHSFEKPDEIRHFPHGRLELVQTASGTIGRLVVEPGWRWSVDVKPIAGTELCEAPHFGYQLTGTLRVRMADGSEFETGPGSISSLPEGHDAWVVGEEPVVMVDWAGMTDYAKPA